MAILRKKRLRRLSEELRLLVESGRTYPGDPFPPPSATEVVGWGRGIEEIVDSPLGPYVNDCVYALTRSHLFFRYIDGSEPTIQEIDLTQGYEEVALAEAVDGRWDIYLQPRGAASASESRGFGFIESYGGGSAMAAADYAVCAAKGTLKDLPDSLARLLSSVDLSDVPTAFRNTAPDDASESGVRHTAERGLVHPFINRGVALRTLFVPFLDQGEVPHSIHRIHVAKGDISSGEATYGAEPRAALLLVTDKALRWQFPNDGFPDLGGSPPKALRFHAGLMARTTRTGSQVIALKSEEKRLRSALYVFYFEDSPDGAQAVRLIKEQVAAVGGRV